MSCICTIEFIDAPIQDKEDISAKRLDVWQDQHLLDYLKTGKLAAGLSSNNVKRLKKLGEFHLARQ